MIASALSTILPQRKAVAGPDDDFWYRPVGVETSSGVYVTGTNSLAVPAVYGCIRLLRESLSSLPWKVYERIDEKNKEPARDYYLWNLLHDRPNSWQTPMDFVEMGVTHLCLRGNFYCRIVQTRGEIELWPLSPDRVTPQQDNSRRVVYKYKDPDGETKTLRSENVFHVRGLSLDGVNGIGVIEHARNAIGSAMAQEKHGAALFKNGGLPTVWISRPKESRWTANARKNFREEWRAVQAGEENLGQPPILSDGMELHSLGLTNKDSQWIESRGFTAEEVCRFFGVSPHMIGIKSTAPLGSIEQQSLEFVLYTLGPLASRFEQAANRDLVREPKRYFTKISLDGLLRGDLKSRYEAHNIAVQGGWKTANEVREVEDMNPIEGGDESRFPLNMQPAGGGPDENEQGGQPGKGLPKEKSSRQAFGVLIADAAARIASHEIRNVGQRAEKASEDRDTFNEWAGTFYTKHAAYIDKAVAPLATAWEIYSDRVANIATITEAVLKASAVVFDATQNTAVIVAGWDESRANELAAIIETALFGEES